MATEERTADWRRSAGTASATRRRRSGRTSFTTLSGEPIQPLYTPRGRLPASEERSACRASFRSPAACTRACTAAGCGRCASSRASARRRRPTSASATCSITGRPGCRTAFDMPSLMGHDSDHARSLGEVGREGVAVDSLDDMETLFAGIDLGAGHGVDDDQRAGGDHAGLLRRRGGGERRAARPARRHDPGRHPQGVHRPEGVVLPGRPGDAAARRHDRVVARASCRAGTRSRSPATTSARPARRPRRSSRSRSRTGCTYVEQAVERGLDVDDFAPRLSFFFNAHIDFFEEIAKYRAARRIWARELRETLRRAQPEVVADAHARADRRRVADGAAAAQQHRPHRDRGAGRRARRHAVAAHQLLRRGARAPDRGGGARRAAHAADHRARDRRDEHDRPARRLLLRRGADRPARGARLRVLRQDRRARRDGRGGQARLPAARDRRRRLHAPAGVRLAARASSSASTTSPRAARASSSCLRIDPALERKQIDRVQGVRARRDSAAVEDAARRAARRGRRRRAT